MTDEGTKAVRRAPEPRYGVLLATLLIVIGATAFVAEESRIAAIVHLAYLVMMASAVYSFSRRRGVFFAGLAIGLSTEIVLGAAQFGASDTVLLAGLGLRMIFLILATAAVFSDIVRKSEISMNTVLGACTVYLLLALSFGAVFGVIEASEPGSFDFKRTQIEATESQIGSMTDWGTLTYYSMITLTTVGYGDVTPVSPAARIMSALEGLFGQLFIAVVLARFVAMEIADRINRNRGSSGG